MLVTQPVESDSREVLLAKLGRERFIYETFRHCARNRMEAIALDLEQAANAEGISPQRVAVLLDKLRGTLLMLESVETDWREEPLCVAT